MLPKQAPNSPRFACHNLLASIARVGPFVGEAPRQAQAVREFYVNANAYDIASNATTIASTTQKCAQAGLETPTLACHNLLASIALIDLCSIETSPGNPWV